MKQPHPLRALFALGLLAAPALAQEEVRIQAAHQRSRQFLEANPSLPYDPTTLLVRFEADQSELQRESLRRMVAGAKLRSFRTVDGLELIEVGINVDDAIARLKPFVEYAEPNWIQRADQIMALAEEEGVDPEVAEFLAARELDTTADQTRPPNS